MTAFIGRREFITLLGGAAVAWPLAARAQQATKIPKIGVLWPTSSEAEEEPFIRSLRSGLQELGYVEGSTVVLENRYASGQYDHFAFLAAELVRLPVDLLIAVTLPAALAAQKATRSIPIVFVLVHDPVATKLVDSFPRPGGLITGFSHMSLDLTAKRLELFNEMTQGGAIAFLVNPANEQFASLAIEETRTAAASLQLPLRVIETAMSDQLEDIFAGMAAERVKNVVLASDAMFFGERTRIAELALRYRMTTMFAAREHVLANGLMSYAPSFTALFRSAASYADKILKGAMPSDLPVGQPTKFELVINLKTAKALGIEVPATLLARADEVIE
jgi:putative ABC transport system substrate-binding protein